MTPKEKLRIFFRNVRKKISSERRKEASSNAFHFLKERLTPFQRILSFANTPEEIDLHLLNEWISMEKNLFLPKIEENDLCIFQITDLASQLLISNRFLLQEPNDQLCNAAELFSIDCILVPGLAFDTKKHRLGYGKGYYDRLLARSQIYSIGIGFKEQMSLIPLPVEPFDQQLSELALF